MDDWVSVTAKVYARLLMVPGIKVAGSNGGLVEPYFTYALRVEYDIDPPPIFAHGVLVGYRVEHGRYLVKTSQSNVEDFMGHLLRRQTDARRLARRAKPEIG